MGQLATSETILVSAAGVIAADSAGLSAVKSYSALLTSIAAMPLAGGTFTGTVIFSNATYPLGTIRVVQASNSGATHNGTATQWLTFREYIGGTEIGGIGVDNAGNFAVRSGGVGFHGLYLTTTMFNLYGGSHGYAIKAFTNTGFNIRNYADSADAPVTASTATFSGAVTCSTSLAVTTTLQLGAYTVATLPSAGSNAGKEAQVTDSNAAASGNYGATVAGGGANRVKVFSDGTNWVIA